MQGLAGELIERIRTGSRTGRRNKTILRDAAKHAEAQGVARLVKSAAREAVLDINHNHICYLCWEAIPGMLSRSGKRLFVRVRDGDRVRLFEFDGGFAPREVHPVTGQPIRSGAGNLENGYPREWIERNVPRVQHEFDLNRR